MTLVWGALFMPRTNRRCASCSLVSAGRRQQSSFAFTSHCTFLSIYNLCLPLIPNLVSNTFSLVIIMSGIHGQVFGHLARRGVEMATAPVSDRQQYVQWLNQQSNLYEEAGPAGEVKPWEFFLPIATAAFFMIILASVRSSRVPSHDPRLT